MEISEIKKSLGHNFIGADELSTINNSFAIKIPTIIPAIPFEKSAIIANKDTHLLLLCPSKFLDGTDITIKNIKKKISMSGETPCFYNQDWYMNETFIDQTLESRWYLVRKRVVEASRAVMPEELMTQHYVFPTAILCAFTFFAYYFRYGEHLWYHDFVWCSDVDHNGDRIYVGKYHDVDGVNKNGFSVHRHLALRACYAAVTMI